MAHNYVPIEMDIGSNRTILINIRSDVATYFGMAIATNADDAVITRRRKGHKRSNFNGLTNTTGTDINVSPSQWKTLRKVANVGSGKKVRIPTKLTSGKKNNIRYTSFRVPSNATVGAISKFLFEKCDAAKRPEFFIMESGTRYPVVNITGDVNPGKS